MKRTIVLLSISGLLAACTQSAPPNNLASERPQTTMVRVAKQVQACWFGKNDPALKKFKMATELDSFSGKPRILIVPRNRPTGLPTLVAQAERINGRNQFSTFGPLLSTQDGPRLNASLQRWAGGSTTC